MDIINKFPALITRDVIIEFHEVPYTIIYLMQSYQPREDHVAPEK